MTGPAAASRPITAVDPICGMTIVVANDTPSLQHAGQTIYFCCMGCKLKFEEGESLRDSLAVSLREPGGRG